MWFFQFSTHPNTQLKSHVEDFASLSLSQSSSSSSSLSSSESLSDSDSEVISKENIAKSLLVKEPVLEKLFKRWSLSLCQAGEFQSSCNRWKESPSMPIITTRAKDELEPRMDAKCVESFHTQTDKKISTHIIFHTQTDRPTDQHLALKKLHAGA